MSTPAFAHVGQYGFHHGDGAEHVHVELPAHFSQRGLLHHAFVTISGVVDEHVHRSDSRFDLLNNAINGREVGYVEYPGANPLRSQCFEVASCLPASHCADYAMTSRDRLLGQRPAETTADASNEQRLVG